MYKASIAQLQACGSDYETVSHFSDTKSRIHTYSIRVLCHLLGSQFHYNTMPQGRFLCQDWGSVKLIVCGNVMADLGLIPPTLGWILECR